MSARSSPCDVDTGELKWHYQVVPGDIWDYDSVQHLMLADLTINGRARKVIMQANKNGFYYVLDRVTGQFISADPLPASPGPGGSIRRPAGRSSIRRRYYGTEPITHLARRRRRAQLVADVVQSRCTGLDYIPTTTSSSSTYAAEPTSTRTTGRMTGTVRGAADRDHGRRRRRSDPSRSKDREAGRAGRLGSRSRSRCAGASPAAAASAAAR